MALSIPAFSSALKAEFQSKFSGGSQLTKFTDAIATGIVNTTVGLTGQIGIPAKSGSSSGVGILSLVSGDMADDIVSTASASFGQVGGSMQDVADAIADIVVAQFSANIDLSSDANGACTFASFSGAISSMASAIENAESSFTGPHWGNFTTAVATGVCNEVSLNGAGTLSGASGGSTGSGVVTIS